MNGMHELIDQYLHLKFHERYKMMKEFGFNYDADKSSYDNDIRFLTELRNYNKLLELGAYIERIC